MRLVALQDVPDSVGVIPKGRTFVCLDGDRAASLIRLKYAEQEGERGWHGLRWPGFEVVILASGPSLNEEQCAAVKEWHNTERRVIAINTSYQLAPWADVLYACDGPWWDEYHSKIEFAGERWTQDEQAAQRYRLKFIPSKVGAGLCKQPGLIFQGMNSGYQAINLAYHAGAKRIVLLGFDMHGGHWHGPHPKGLNKRLPFKQWIPLFDPLAKDLKAAGVEVLNATPGSALTAFPLIKLQDALA